MKKKRREDWRELVQSCRESEMSVYAWCKMNNISYSTYQRWRKILDKEFASDEKPHSEPIAWCKVETNNTSTAHIEAFSYEADTTIKLNYGLWSLELKQGFEPELLMKIMKVVEARC